MSDPPVVTRRTRLRAEAIAEIERHALAQVAEGGPESLSLNAIARSMGISGPALYRYVASRDELLAVLVASSYRELAETLEAAALAARRRAPEGRLGAVASAYRDWALAHPHRYRLVFSTPYGSGRLEPEEIVPAAHRSMTVMLDAIAALGPVPDRRSGRPSALDRQLERWAGDRSAARDLPPAILRLGLIAWTRLHGIVSLQIEGALASMDIDPAALLESEVDQLIAQRLTPAPARVEAAVGRPAGGPGPWTGSLHVTNGDATVPGLVASGLADAVLPWRDVLHEGPVPDVPDEELRSIRAAFLAGENAGDIGSAADFAHRDRTLEAHRHGPYVLWFEADLYDQLQLVQILAKLRELEVPPGQVTLICIGEHVGIAHFGGLGELTAKELGRLPATAAITLSAAALEHAARAWAALRAPDPGGLGAIATTHSPELRFLAEAFDRLSREYPSTRDGLSMTERRILGAVSGGAATAGAAFDLVRGRELRPFLGDTWCFDRMTRMLAAPTPLLEAETAAVPVDRHARLRLTEAGRLVLEGREDHVSLNGVDRWVGGVHLAGRKIPWRFDEGTESITPTPRP